MKSLQVSAALALVAAAAVIAGVVMLAGIAWGLIAGGLCAALGSFLLYDPDGTPEQ